MRSKNRGIWNRGPAHIGAAVVVIALSAGALAYALATDSTAVDSASSERPAPLMRIDVNSATAAQLQVLPGIGPSRAEAIITDRERNGPFASIDDLTRVHGIGERTVARLREFVRISDLTE